MVNFILNGLNNSVGLDTSPQYPTNFASVESDISSAFIATIEVSKANVIAAGIAWSDFPINKTLFFKTTSPELTTSTSDNDMAFKCVSSMWPDISFSEAKVTSGKESVDVYSTGLKKPMENPTFVGHLSNDIRTTSYYRVNTIGPARLAFEITGGYNNSDIFSNEGDLRQQYLNLDTSGNTGDSNAGIGQNIRLKLEHAHAGSDASPSTNANATINNVAREVLVQLLNSNDPDDIQRVHNMISDASGSGNPAGNTSDLWIPIVFDVNDSIRFKVTYNVTSIKDSTTGAAKDSNDKVLGTGVITDQEFEFRLNITT